MDPDIEEALLNFTIVPVMKLTQKLDRFESEYLQIFDERGTIPEARAINEEDTVIDQFYFEMEKRFDAHL
jgi:hypothetical protein